MMFPVVRTNGRNLFPAWDPWTQLTSEVGRFVGDVLAPGSSGMPVDIREEGHDIVIEADLPGVAQSDLDITVENGTLAIAVTQKAETEESRGNYFVRERRSGYLTRTFRLPDTADLDKIEAQFANGVLTLRVPRKEEAKPRQIAVK